MNDIEQGIRELPLPGPTTALDERIADLLSTARIARPPSRTRLGLVVGTALAAGLAGFSVGLGTGPWFVTPRQQPVIVRQASPHDDLQHAGESPKVVQLTDGRISAGLDFSQSLEPFQIHPVVHVQEGS